MLDKKALRKFAADNPAPAIPPGHGLLHTSQVDHIVRTAVRTIGRRRTLVLYVYDREQVTAGGTTPAWTMFQAGEDYITLARRDDGSVRWRKSAFRNLGGYRFADKCAFYSARDERRVCGYFHDHGHGGMEALVRAQQAIMDRRTLKRRLMREKKTVERMRPLRAYLNHPRLEHMVKTGFFNLASDLAYRSDPNRVLDESQGRTHRILRVQAEDVPFLRELDPGMGVLKIFQGYAGLKDRRELLRWQLDNQVSRDVVQVLEHMTPHRLMKYMDAQYAAPLPDGSGARYGNMQRAVSEYRDYLGMCAQLCRDLSDGSVLYPRDLRTAHDRVQGDIKARSDARLRQAFVAAMEAAGRLEFQSGGMAVVLPATPDDVVAEGRASTIILTWIPTGTEENPSAPA